jgi:hypothetical protein
MLLLVPLLPAYLLFTYLDSFAKWTGSLAGGTLKVGGAAALYISLVLLGWMNPPQAPSFSTTIYLFGPRGHQDLILRGTGQAIIDTGSLRRKQPIGADGEAVFLEIPAHFLDQEVPIALDADGFELADPHPTARLGKAGVYVGVRRKTGRVKGYVQDEEGRPLPGVTLALAEMTKSSDNSGYFEFVIPSDQMQSDMTLRAAPPGFAAWSIHVEPNSGDIPVTLHRQR